MQKFKITFIVLTILASVSFESYASSTAWYKVEKIKQILKLVDSKCVDDKVIKCARTQHWRVFYKATSKFSQVQKFQRTFEEGVPPLGAVMQMTVELPKGKAAMMQP